MTSAAASLTALVALLLAMATVPACTGFTQTLGPEFDDPAQWDSAAKPPSFDSELSGDTWSVS